MSIEELLEQIHRWESATSPSSVPADEYEPIAVSLAHNHLPKIEDATHIEYHRDDKQIRISGVSRGVDILLSVSKTIEQPARSSEYRRPVGRD